MNLNSGNLATVCYVTCGVLVKNCEGYVNVTLEAVNVYTVVHNACATPVGIAFSKGVPVVVAVFICGSIFMNYVNAESENCTNVRCFNIKYCTFTSSRCNIDVSRRTCSLMSVCNLKQIHKRQVSCVWNTAGLTSRNNSCEVICSSTIKRNAIVGRHYYQRRRFGIIRACKHERATN